MGTNATLSQAGHVLTLIDRKMVTKEQLVGAVSNGTLPDFFEAMAIGTVPSREELRVFLGLGPLVLKIVVDYSMTLGQMIAAGGYRWRNDDINDERFPLLGEGKVENTVELIHFNRPISSNDAEKELDKMGFRPAIIEELLAFAAAFPETQRKSPIVALGSVAKIGPVPPIDDDRYVVYLGMHGSGRRLSLNWRGDEWSGIFRFLAVRK